jgi:hypothetical protein
VGLSQWLEWHPKATNVPLFALTSLLLVVTGGWLVRSAFQVDAAMCQDTAHRLPARVLLGVAGAALITGRLLGRVPQPAQSTEPGGKVADLVGSAALALVFLGMTGALVFEAEWEQEAWIRGQRVPDLEPITSYVRCALVYDKDSSLGFGFWTAIVLLLTCGLVGHWLWPWRTPQRSASDGDGRPLPKARIESSPSARSGRLHPVAMVILGVALVLGPFILAAVFEAGFGTRDGVPLDSSPELTARGSPGLWVSRLAS